MTVSDNTQRLILFTLGESQDHQGRTIADIWAFSREELETTHDYIQWLFPLPEPSQVNLIAPLLTDEAQRWFKQSPELQTQQQTSLARMANFFGLHEQTRRYEPTATLIESGHPWLTPMNHNHLRITRIIKSLQLCGQTELAQKFQAAVLRIGQEHGQVSNQNLGYWERAIKGAI